MSTAVARAFDALARTYDRRFTHSRVGSAQRQAVWRVLDRVFTPGDSVFEINCGTGADAAHLAARGIRVHGCDVSAGMIEVAGQRLRGVRGVEVEQRSAEDLAGVPGPYDGLFSNFGGINCVEDLPSALAQFKRLVRVGGSVILCYMGPFCAWEVLWYLLHGKPRAALRRFQRSAMTAGFGEQFRIEYPTVACIARALTPEFRLLGEYGVGVFVPPSYAEGLAAAHPSVLEVAVQLDRAVAAWPIFRSVGDHVMLHFRKVSA